MDWANTHLDTEFSTMDVNEPTDFVRDILTNGYSAASIRGRLPATELASNSWLSPASLMLKQDKGLFAGFPPTFILAGGAEQTVDGMRTFRDRLIRDSGEGKVVYREYPDGFHDFLIISWHEPERSQALGEIGTWLTRVLHE